MNWFIVELHYGLLKVDTITLTQGLSFQLWKKSYSIVNTKKIEIIFSDQFCKLEKCLVCKNNKYNLVASKCPFIGLRKSKNFKVLKESDIILGNLNLLG